MSGGDAIVRGNEGEGGLRRESWEGAEEEIEEGSNWSWGSGGGIKEMMENGKWKWGGEERK